MGENDAGAASGVAVTDTIDIAGTNNLTFQGPAYYTNDVAATAASDAGSSLSINFTNSAYATHAIVSTNVDNFGIECWVKPTALGGGQVIAYNGITGGAGDGGWGIIIAADNTYEALFGGVVGFGTNVATANVWTHLALVRDSGTSTLYINGVASATNPEKPGVPAGNFALAAPPQSPTSQLFTGLVDEVRVFTFAPGQFSTNDLLFNTPAFVQSNTPLPGLEDNASLAWGDFDNDGRLDILLCGSDRSGTPFTQVWRNTGSGFTNINAGLPGVSFGSVAWGDFDNDGRLDILLCGYNGSVPITQVWRNTGSGFTNINAGLPGVDEGAAVWGDYDNDGRLDILLCGYNGTNNITQVWRNTGNGFTNINAGLPGVYAGSVAWGDYDNDGRLDILLCGYNGTTNITQVWRNTGNGFTNINAGLPGVDFGSVAWGDYDNDGRLDILLCGTTNESVSPITEVWRNTGNGFTNINAGLPGVEEGAAVWGDYDNDGQLDILLCGNNDSFVPITEVWRNTGNGFAEIQDLTGVGADATVAWGDYNNDGRLDFLISGQLLEGALTNQLWLNQIPTTNSPPTAPTGLTMARLGSSLTLSWNASSDLQTPVSGLSYNLRVGTTPGGSDILAPMADTNGMRLIPQRGNIQGTQLTLQLPFVPDGTTLYWSVQSIGTSFAGSPFAPEATFVLRPSFTSSGMTSDGTFEAQFNVLSGTNYTIQASTDLVHWVDLLDFNFGSSGPFLFTDPDAANYPQRFYRFGQH